MHLEAASLHRNMQLVIFSVVIWYASAISYLAQIGATLGEVWSMGEAKVVI